MHDRTPPPRRSMLSIWWDAPKSNFKILPLLNHQPWNLGEGGSSWFGMGRILYVYRRGCGISDVNARRFRALQHESSGFVVATLAFRVGLSDATLPRPLGLSVWVCQDGNHIWKDTCLEAHQRGQPAYRRRKIPLRVAAVETFFPRETFLVGWSTSTHAPSSQLVHN